MATKMSVRCGELNNAEPKYTQDPENVHMKLSQWITFGLEDIHCFYLAPQALQTLIDSNFPLYNWRRYINLLLFQLSS